MTAIILFSLLLGACAGFLAGLLGIGGGLEIGRALVGMFSLASPKIAMSMALATFTSLFLSICRKD
jgi:uncharacterized protein